MNYGATKISIKSRDKIFCGAYRVKPLNDEAVAIDVCWAWSKTFKMPLRSTYEYLLFALWPVLRVLSIGKIVGRLHVDMSTTCALFLTRRQCCEATLELLPERGSRDALYWPMVANLTWLCVFARFNT